MQSRVPPRARRPIHSKSRPQFRWTNFGRDWRRPDSANYSPN